MKYRILFVDDEVKVLNGLRRMLFPMREKWEMVFVDSGFAALEAMAQQEYDVVISDMRMPGMDGVTLMAELMDQYPWTIRIALSGQLEQDLVIKTVKTVHQFLTKPCDVDRLQSTIERACALREVLNDTEMKILISKIDSLPSLPPLYEKLTRELQSEEPSIHEVAEIIAADVGMTAKIMQMVNSAFFGLPRKIYRPFDAVNLLGLERIRTLVLSCEIFAMYEDSTVITHKFLRSLSEHSIETAAYSRTIAKYEKMPPDQTDDVFLSSMLHDVGKLVLFSHFKEEYKALLTQSEVDKEPMWQLEQMKWGVNHAGVGAYLMGLWGLTPVVVDLIAFHHSHDRLQDREVTPLTVLYAANLFAAGGTLTMDPAVSNFVEQKIAEWADICSL